MNPTLAQKKEKILAGMLDYMQRSANAGYSKEDIAECGKILTSFAEELEKLGSNAPEARIMNFIENAVLKLNHLNVRAGDGLIETMQREQICDYILIAAKECGLKTGEDVTEAWREW